jgi:hypothetical protein
MLDMRGTEKRRKGFANVKAYCIGILCNVSPSPTGECYPFPGMIRLDLQPEIDAQLASEAQARGLALDRYIEKIVESRPTEQSVHQHRTRSVSEAIDRILELREGTDLSGLSIKELIDAGRKY